MYLKFPKKKVETNVDEEEKVEDEIEEEVQKVEDELEGEKVDEELEGMFEDFKKRIFHRADIAKSAELP